MRLRKITIKDEGLIKVLIVDDDKKEGKLVAWVTATTDDEAQAEAKDVAEAIMRNGKELVWN